MKIKRWILSEFDENCYQPSSCVFATYQEAYNQMKAEVLKEDPEMSGEYTSLEEMSAHTEEGEWYYWRIYEEEIELTHEELLEAWQILDEE